MNKTMKLGALCALVLMPFLASAQITYTPNGGNKFDGFPSQNALGPKGDAYQVSYPYEGQCVANAALAGPGTLFPTLTACNAAASSFTCAATGGVSQRTAGGWAACGALSPFKELAPIIPNSAAVLPAVATPKFVWEFLNPPDYTPDHVKYGATVDYYELAVHEAWGFQTAASLHLFPNPTVGTCTVTGAYCDATTACVTGTCTATFPGAPAVPNGMQWTGLTCNIAAGCTCPPDADPLFAASYCSALGKIPYGYPLYTPVWGAGSALNGVALPAGPAAPWSANNYLATWPSISIRATRGTPVVVKWMNEFPNSHVLCPHADAADWPCSIDRTFMGVKSSMDPAALQGMPIAANKVTQYGSPQQPDNSWVTHLHGGEIPPSTDGFAEKWFGNAITAATYNVGGKLVTPAFENPSNLLLKRPNGPADVYAYPMDQSEALIWWHDHTLGKTHHNVIAGPAGLVPVKEPAKHGTVTAGLAGTTCPPGVAACTTEYTWLDPVTEPRKYATALNLAVPMYDQFIVIQDRAFNDDGSLNFSNGLGQTVAQPPLAPFVPGNTSITPGVNPLVHPTWVPEYFGDHALVNGVLWPKVSTEPGWYRLRFVDGSDSRCYTLGFQVSPTPPAPGAAVSFQVPFYVIANDQGYLQAPFKATGNRFTMCPGERYEILVNFGALPGQVVNAATLQPAPLKVWLVNNAPAPFPAGFSPQVAGGQPELNVIMGFDVNAAFGPGVKTCGQTVTANRVVNKVAPASLTWDATLVQTAAVQTNANLAKSVGGVGAVAAGFYANLCMPANPALQIDPNYVDIRGAVTAAAAAPLAFPAGSIVRQVYLNERIDGVTLFPLGMQLNGVPFEYKVTETPKFGSTEYWQFINLTVDAHPMHPHLVKHQLVARQNLNVGAYKRALCGSTTCQPGTSPGGEMQVVPDVNLTVAPGPFLTGAAVLTTPASNEGGYKDAVQVPPNKVTTIVAKWAPTWVGANSGTVANPVGAPTAPGSIACPVDSLTPCAAPPWTYEAVTAGPYVWHCHINSHEDSEMMRTSLVVP